MPATWNSGVHKRQEILPNETLVYYRMYPYRGDATYLNATLNIAHKLPREVRTGSPTQSFWPDRVLVDSGKITSE